MHRSSQEFAAFYEMTLAIPPVCLPAAEGIKLARREGAGWVLHIDTDELMYPGGAPHYSLQVHTPR